MTSSGPPSMLAFSANKNYKIHNQVDITISINQILQILYLVGMGDNKNFMSQYIIRVIIMIIDIIMVSLNSATGTKSVKMKCKYFTDMNVPEQ